MAFAKRKIDLTFLLGQGDFGDAAQSPIVKVSGLRTSVEINTTNGPELGEAHVRVNGLTLDIMSRLYPTSTFAENGVFAFRHNDILIEAGDEGTVPSIIYHGNILLATMDMNDAPNTALVVVAQAGGFSSVKPIPASSYPNGANARTIMENLAAQGGYIFEGNDVDVQLATPYYSGGLRDQMDRCAEDANIYAIIDEKTFPNTLAVWMKNGPGREGTVPLISAETGMVGYPVPWGRFGLSVRTLFNPTLRMGSKVDVRSQLPFANGRFIIFQINHTIQSETPNGQWFTQFNTQRLPNQ